MRIVELSVNDFEEFANSNSLRNYYQTPLYANVMAEKGYTSDYIGYRDDSNNLVGASLILKKKIGTFAKFVYAPKGPLFDYYDTELLKLFIKDLCSFYRKKGYSFLKINPEIIIGELNKDNNYQPYLRSDESFTALLKQRLNIDEDKAVLNSVISATITNIIIDEIIMMMLVSTAVNTSRSASSSSS